MANPCFLFQTEVKTEGSVFWRIILVYIQSELNYFSVQSYVHPSTWPHCHCELLSVTAVTESNTHERTSDETLCKDFMSDQIWFT